MDTETPRNGDGDPLCEWCGGEVKQPPTGRRRAYCSRTHREYAYRKRREQRLMLSAYTRGKRDAEEWSVSSTVPTVSTTDGRWVRSVDEIEAQLRDLEQRRKGQPDGAPTTEPR